MQEIKKLKIIGYVQLYMKFWVVDAPEIAFYDDYDVDFTVPIDEALLKGLLKMTGEFCEKANKVKVDGMYITKEQYMKETKSLKDKGNLHRTNASFDTKDGPIKVE